MKLDDLIHILVISDQPSLINRVLSELRKDGSGIRITAVENEKDFNTRLHTPRDWHVIVCFEGVPTLAPDRALQLRQQAQLEIPFILAQAAGSTYDPATFFQMGASDVLSNTELDKLPYRIKYEAAAYQLQIQTRKLALQLKELEKRHQILLDCSGDAVSYIHEGMHRYCNQSYAAFFGYPDIISVSTTPLLDLAAKAHRSKLKQCLVRALAGEETLTLQGEDQKGNPLDMKMSFKPVQFDGETCLQLTVTPASGNVDYARQLSEIESQDLLTRLDNRSHFMNRVERAISAALNQKIYSSLLLINLNEFVDIETTLGKSNTNLILADISGFLQKSIKKPFAAARLEDHEFALLLYDGNPQEALELADFIKSKINNQITSSSLPSLQLSCSVGIAAINGHALDAEGLVLRARTNLRAVLETETNYQFRIGQSLTPDIHDIIQYLDEAIEKHRFKLLFQPVVSLKGEEAQNYEVLIRMLDADDNEIPPGFFMPTATLNGLGETLDRLVITDVLTRIRDSKAGVNLTLNLTSQTLASKTFLPWLSKTLADYRTPPDLLDFQISEIDLCHDPERTLAFCRGLEELNLQRSLSHFGCAVEPFQYLEKIGPAIVTLDATLIRDVVYSYQQRELVQKLVDTLHTRGIKVGAPQVENMDVLPILWQSGFDLAQGFCLQSPRQEMDYEFFQEQEITQSALPSRVQ